MADLVGKIHSIETCGTVDGPGIRFVVFFQGCPMRCKYCHNPDSWEINAGREYTADEILLKYEGVKEFCKGGITATGGEPTLQIDFLTELFMKAKEKKIHTALDTSGICYKESNSSKYEKLLKYTDLVMLDIKHIDNVEHKKLTGHENTDILNFARYLSDKNIPVWIRHVVVPKITYNEIYLKSLGEFLSHLNNIKALDVLAYHDMAVPKYEKLGFEYPLKGVSPLTKDEAIKARNIIIKAMKDYKNKV